MAKRFSTGFAEEFTDALKMNLTTRGVMTEGLVSVVILTWNRCADLLETLTELEKSTYRSVEVIVVDNNSSDGTAEMVREKFSRITFISLPVNSGIAGYNTGFKKARGEYILVLDNDSFPERGSIGRMVRYFKTFPSLGVAAFDVKNYSGRESKPEKYNGKGEAATGYNGAGAGIRRSCMEKAGNLFEPFFLYLNEQDHSLRILRCGYEIRFFPDLVAYHKQASSARSNERMAYFYTRNLLWMVWRNFPLSLMIRSTFRILFFANLYSIKLRNTVYIRAVIDAASNLEGVVATRNPVKPDIIKRARIPLTLAFSVYG